jgi:hypothetical protein
MRFSSKVEPHGTAAGPALEHCSNIGKWLPSKHVIRWQLEAVSLSF